jgi:predicted glycogen debranching enzyme
MPWSQSAVAEVGEHNEFETHLPIHHMAWAELQERDPQLLLSREWLVSNGLGGYASASVSGACTRRYHGLLIASLPAPLGRMVMFNHLAEEVRLPGGIVVHLGAEEREDTDQPTISVPLNDFRLDSGLPVWRYDFDGFSLEKRVLLPYRSNTVHVTYRLLGGAGHVRLRLRPSIHFRPHEASVAASMSKTYTLGLHGTQCEICSPDLPPLRLQIIGVPSAFVADGGHYREIYYRVEQSRGYEGRGLLWSPGYFKTDLHVGEEATLVGSTENWEAIHAIKPADALQAELDRRQRLISQAHPAAQRGPAAALVLAADQFIITPTTRVIDAVRAHAAGDEVRTVIAGYHWFTDWGRDTMISLDGLTLATGRHIEAGYILRTFAHYVRDGLIPNLFPEGQREGLYHTADASLWFFHALQRYLEATRDQFTLKQVLPKLLEIVDCHLRGTRFGIHVDPADGLLAQGAEGYQLTWMDAKVGDWVVTPRRGKAVEINALWYNALRLLQGWLSDLGDLQQAQAIGSHADRAYEAFNRRFWNGERGCLYDIVDGASGDDPLIRPNQVFAIALDHPVLARDKWAPTLKVVVERLLTPMGLRTLAPGESDYKPRYDGDLRSRDAAYHQGTVWAWLVGPFIDAWLKVHPDQHASIADFLAGFANHLGEAGLGSISEIFDAEAPYTPRGCIAQAWSVAEVLRCWIKLQQD